MDASLPLWDFMRLKAWWVSSVFFVYTILFWHKERVKCICAVNGHRLKQSLQIFNNGYFFFICDLDSSNKLCVPYQLKLRIEAKSQLCAWIPEAWSGFSVFYLKTWKQEAEFTFSSSWLHIVFFFLFHQCSQDYICVIHTHSYHKCKKLYIYS